MFARGNDRRGQKLTVMAKCIKKKVFFV